MSFMLLHYLPEGNSGGCGRGCCGPDYSWDAEMVFGEAATQEEAISDSAKMAAHYYHCGKQWEHYLLRPATADELEAEEHCFYDDGGEFYGKILRFSLHDTEAYKTALGDLVATAEAAEKQRKAALAAAEQEAALKARAARERAEYERLKAKFETKG